MDEEKYKAIVNKNKAKQQLMLLQEKAREALQHFDEDFEFKGFESADQPEEVVCPICCEIMDVPERQPITLFPCGHTICKSCLETSRKNYYMKCGVCRSTYKSEAVNYALWNIIQTKAYIVPKNKTKELPKTDVTIQNRIEILEPILKKAEEKLESARAYEEEIENEYYSVQDEIKFDSIQLDQQKKILSLSQSNKESLDNEEKRIKEQLASLIKQYDKLKLLVEATESLE